MKKILMAVVAVALVAVAGSAMAAQTTVEVSATVTGTCLFNTGAYSVAFVLDPAVGGNVNGTVVQPTFWCTRGTNYTITDDDGLYESGTTHQMRHATDTTAYIPYSFAYTATGSGGGKGTTITMNITSQVANADFINALAGDYADTVLLTIAP